MAENRIAMFELTMQDDQVRVGEEKHYRLVPAESLDPIAVRTYR